MAIDKKTKVDKTIKVFNFVKDIKGKLKRIPNYSGIHAHVRSIVDNGTVRTEPIKMTRLQKLMKIGLNSDETAKVLIYSDHGLRWNKNTGGLNHQKEMDNFIDIVVSKPIKQINEFVAFVKDNYIAPKGVEVDNEDFIRRWKGAYEVLNVQDQSPELSILDLLWTFLII